MSNIITDYDRLPVPAINDYKSPSLLVTNDTDYYSKDIYAVISFSGDYTSDSSVMVAGSGEGIWKDIKNGTVFNSAEQWHRGAFYNTEIYDDTITLSSGQLFGTWTSPIIDVGEYDVRYVYTYGSGIINQMMESRASDDAPFPRFVIYSNDSSLNYNWLMSSKRLYIEPTGDEIAYSYAGLTGLFENIDFRSIPTPDSVVGHKYYPGIDNLGMVGYLIPGQLKYIYDTVSDDWADYFLFCSSYEDMSLNWANGFNIAGWGDILPLSSPLDWGILGSIVIPDNDLMDSWHVYCTMIELDSPYGLYTMYAHVFAGKIISSGELFEYPVLLSSASLTTFDMCSADDISTGVWFYTGDTVLTVQKYQGNTLRASYTLSSTYRYITNLPSKEPGFWAIDDSSATLFREINGILIQDIVITSDNFTNLVAVSADIYNNAWLLDIDSNTVFKIDYTTQSIVYQTVVPGILGIWAHPTDGTVYVYNSIDVDWIYGEVIRRIDPVLNESILICSIDGYRNKKPLDISFYGSPLGCYEKISASDPIWGARDGLLPWEIYDADTAPLSKGRFKQLRFTFQRNRVTDPAPSITQLLVPQPAVEYNVAPRDSTKFFMRPNTKNTFRRGKFYPKLRVYWSG